MKRKKPSKPRRAKTKFKGKRLPKIGYVVADDGCFDLPPKKKGSRK